MYHMLTRRGEVPLLKRRIRKKFKKLERKIRSANWTGITLKELPQRKKDSTHSTASTLPMLLPPQAPEVFHGWMLYNFTFFNLFVYFDEFLQFHIGSGAKYGW
jgi:hypothetical protein